MRIQLYDIIVYKGNTFTSKIIKCFLKSQYVHVGVLLDEWHIADTNIGYNLRVRHLDYSIGDYEIYRHENLTSEQKELMKQFLLQNLNDKYSMWENIRYLLTKWLGIRFKDEIYKYNCSEMIVDMFHYAGVDLFDYDSNKVIMPHELIKSEKLTKVL